MFDFSRGPRRQGHPLRPLPSRQDLTDGILAHAIGKANTALDTVVIDHGPAPRGAVAPDRFVLAEIDQYRTLLAAAQRDLPPARIRHHHDQAMARVERLIARGQVEGEFRTDLPSSWLVATFYSLMHAAAEEVDTGRLHPDQAAGVLSATLLATLAAPATPRRAHPPASPDRSSSS